MSSRTKLKSLSKQNHFISRAKREKNHLMNISKRKTKDTDKMKQYHINNYQNYVKKYLDDTEYEIYDFINRGKFGSVFLICNKHTGGNCKALKVSLFKKDDKIKFEKEVEMQKEFHKYGLSLDVIHSDMIRLDKKYMIGIIIMDLIEGTIYDFLKKKRNTFVLNRIIEWLQIILKKMCKYNLIHGDLHLDNIGYIITDEGKMRPVILDFGWAAPGKCKPMLEILQFIRLLDSYEIDVYNRYYLFEVLMKLVQIKYKYVRSMQDIDELWEDISDDYAYEEYQRYISRGA